MDYIDNKQQRLVVKRHIGQLKQKLLLQYILSVMLILVALIILFNLSFRPFFVAAFFAGVASFFSYKIRQSLLQYSEILQGLRNGDRLDVEDEELVEELIEEKATQNISVKNILIVLIIVILYIISLRIAFQSEIKEQQTNAESENKTVLSDTGNTPVEHSVSEPIVKPKINNRVKSKGWEPEEACLFLEDTGHLATSNHMKYQDSFGDGEYMCASREWELSSNSDSVPNDLSYRVLGTKKTVTTLKLVLDLHQPHDESAKDGVVLLSNYASKLAIKATGDKLPERILKGVLAGESSTVRANGFIHSVLNKPFPSGRGYEIHYILMKK